jgi:hypothetical protein
VHGKQGDQIGRIFADWAIINLGRFFAPFSAKKACINIEKRWVWLHFGRIFTNSSGHSDGEREF